MNAEAPLRPTRVWDLPTRLFHWLLFTAVVGLVVTGHVGGPAMQWHLRLGLMVLALLAFRVVWGFVGGRWSRFSSFLFAPGTIVRYARGGQRAGEWFDVGHNPLGSLSVFALLALLAVQVGTGLVADDEIATTGPLNRFVSSAKALQATAWHKGPGQWILVALIALHVVAIAVYAHRGKRLLPAMWHGDKDLPADVPASDDGALRRVLALAVAVACLAVAGWVARL